MTSVSTPLAGTPRQDGFHMPGEFEPHTQCWMLWPERPDFWRENAQPAQAAFARVAAAIARFEPVTLGASAGQLDTARRMVPDGVHVVEMAYDDAWARDTGPTFVVNREGALRGVDWAFNAWGGREEGAYYPWDRDAAVAAHILALAGAARYRTELILEGGSIHVDGQGTLLATAECLLNPNRNPALSQSDIEETLRQYLGVETIIWLPLGVYNDDTDGHVDNLCCFARPGEVILTWTDDAADPQYERSHAAYEVLRRASDARSRTLTIHKLHQPTPLYVTAKEAAGLQPCTEPGSHAFTYCAGDRLPGSYVNFYMANGGIVMPLFDDATYDRRAIQMLQSIFPERSVVRVPSRDILLGGGNIHCITQQQPRTRPLPRNDSLLQ